MGSDDRFGELDRAGGRVLARQVRERLAKLTRDLRTKLRNEVTRWPSRAHHLKQSDRNGHELATTAVTT